MNNYRLATLILATALLIILFDRALDGQSFLSGNVFAAPGSVDCVKGKNGIKGSGCSGTVTLKLAPGGVFTSTNGFGLRVNNASGDLGTAGLYGQQGGGTGNKYIAAGVWGDSLNSTGVLGTSTNGYGVSGDSINSYGVKGESLISKGVAGYSDNAWGVYGYSGNNFAMFADGDVSQPRGKGGWVKAMAWVTPGAGINDITDCYNSQRVGTLVSLPPCGFTVTTNTTGDYTIDFGFQVNDRFIFVTPHYDFAGAVIPTIAFQGSNKVRVRTYKGDDSLVFSYFYIAIY